jgi:hypothetical protein
LLVGSLLPVLSQQTLRLSEHQRQVNQWKLQRFQSITHDWTSVQKNLNDAFIPKPDFEKYRQKAKKQYEVDESSPNLLGDDLHQMPNNSSTFMTRIIERALGKIAANDERRQVLNPRVAWDVSIDRFEVFKNNVEGHYGQK